MLSLGATGANVELLQLGINRTKTSQLVIDGIFFNETENAVINFQREWGLEETGVADIRTWNALTPFLTGFVNHTIASGDTFYTLARKYNSTIEAIETANPDINPQNLLIGSIIIVPLSFDVVPTNISFSSSLMEYALSGLAARYPFLRTGVIGKSILGRNIYYIDIGEGEHNVFYNASHHANEWITSPILMHFLENFSKALIRNEVIGGIPSSEIYTAATISLVPLVNPDGVDLVTGALNKTSEYEYARMLAENYPEIEFPSGWKANIRGVDLNLQYPAGWDIAKEIKFEQGFIYPGPRDYVGSSPLSEPESRAVYDFTNDRNFALTLSYHTQGEVIYWKYKDYEPERSWEIAQRLSYLSGYAAEETPYGSGNAGYKDWFIQNFNRPGYTIEAGLGTNPLPIELFDKIYNDNEGMLAYSAIANI